MNHSIPGGTHPAREDISPALYRKIGWRLLPIISICYAVAIIDRVNVSFAKLEMSADIGLSAAAYGLGAGIFFLAYCLFEVPSNMLLERVGARIWIMRIMVSWGVVVVATGFVQNTGQFYTARVLLGIAEAGFYPGMVFFLSQWFPRKRLAQALALMVIAGPLASVFVGPLSGWIMSAFGGIAEMPGWRWIFILQGAPAIVLGIVFFLAMSNGPKDAKWLTPEEKQELSLALGKKDVKPERAGYQLRQALSKKRVWLLGFIMGTSYLGIYAVTFWVPSIISSTGIKDVTTVGYLSAIPWAFAVVVTILLGRYCDRTQSHRRTLMIGLGVASLGLILSFALGHSTIPTLFGISVAAAFFTAVGPIIWTIANLQLRGMTAAAAGIALINTVASVGSFLGPYIMGIGQDLTGGVTAPFLAIAATALLGALAVVALPRLSSTPAASQDPRSQETLEAEIGGSR